MITRACALLGLNISAAIPQDVESSSWNLHRTKKMSMHFMRSLRAFRSGQQGFEKKIPKQRHP